MKRVMALIVLCLVLTACASSPAGTPTPEPTLAALNIAPPPTTVTPFLPAAAQATNTAVPSATGVPSATAVPSAPAVSLATAVPPALADPPQSVAVPGAPSAAQIPLTRQSSVPAFDHVIIILFENHDYSEVIGNPNLPTFNELAQQNVLLTQYHAVAHPSLPNYLALIGGSTFGIASDCGGCFVNQASLPDLIEGSGRTWKTYQENMPAPCTVGGTDQYDENHDPFVYFDPIRTDKARCERSVVPLTQLDADLNANALPNYAFIVPNICNDAHSCYLATADSWLKQMVNRLQSSPALGQNYMIMIVFDESSYSDASCCGMPAKAGGRVPAILISPLAKNGFQDSTPLSHYSLLKTILQAWNLPDLGFTANPQTQPITAPWKGP